MTEPTPHPGHTTSNDATVSGGDAADRMDSPGPGSGGLPGAGPDGETGARQEDQRERVPGNDSGVHQLRKKVGGHSPILAPGSDRASGRLASAASAGLA